MVFNFDEVVDRRGTNSMKWDTGPRFMGRLGTERFDEDTISVYTADMDFRCPPSVKEEIMKVVEHNIYGYTTMVAKRAVDLVLAGHNHGGQIKLFGKGVFSSSGRLFPKYDSGVFENRLVVSAGCANTFAMPRFGNPRELVVIRLTPAQE